MPANDRQSAGGAKKKKNAVLGGNQT
ncbi:hypothetical protein J008_05943 [Cryptococcus neoformans]|nr:hypothetical protein J008_05943 [Cryptococcus neoformans var. grubii]